MAEPGLHLMKIPLRPAKLVQLARRRRIAIRDLDDGYLAHCILRELWQERAPAPFVLRGRGRSLDAWGYTTVCAASLIDHAREFGDPELLAVIDDVEAISSKPIPRFSTGRQIGFHLRACPVVRLAKARAGHRARAEIDAFLARCFQVGRDVPVSRDEVYRDWLQSKLVDASVSGVTVARIAVAGFARERLIRRTQGETRAARRLERPDVRFVGELVVTEAERFRQLLKRGIGRHRAFGFGALMIVPPGAPYPHA